MDWLLILVAAAVAAVISRGFVSVRKRRKDQVETWDAKAIAHIRAQGGDPFKDYDVDFFFAVPNDEAAGKVRARLETEGFTVDSKRVEGDNDYPISVHARKSMRLSAPDMTALSAHLGGIAKAHDSRYDGWAAV